MSEILPFKKNDKQHESSCKRYIFKRQSNYIKMFFNELKKLRIFKKIGDGSFIGGFYKLMNKYHSLPNNSIAVTSLKYKIICLLYGKWMVESGMNSDS